MDNSAGESERLRSSHHCTYYANQGVARGCHNHRRRGQWQARSGHRGTAVRPCARRILYTSHMGASTTSPFAPMIDHAATEAAQRESGVAFTSLRNRFYMDPAPLCSSVPPRRARWPPYRTGRDIGHRSASRATTGRRAGLRRDQLSVRGRCCRRRRQAARLASGARPSARSSPAGASGVAAPSPVPSLCRPWVPRWWSWWS